MIDLSDFTEQFKMSNLKVEGRDWTDLGVTPPIACPNCDGSYDISVLSPLPVSDPVVFGCSKCDLLIFCRRVVKQNKNLVGGAGKRIFEVIPISPLEILGYLNDSEHLRPVEAETEPCADEAVNSPISPGEGEEEPTAKKKRPSRKKASESVVADPPAPSRLDDREYLLGLEKAFIDLTFHGDDIRTHHDESPRFCSCEKCINRFAVEAEMKLRGVL